MNTPFEFEEWSSDVEFGHDMHEFGDAETEWEAEFGRRARTFGPVARPGIVRRRPFQPPLVRAPWPRRPSQWPARPLYYPVILPQWGGWLPDSQPRPPAADALDAEPPGSEPPGREPPPMQDQPPSGQFNIEPEAFEFESGLDEWETGLGEFKDGFGEFEGAQPKPATQTACPGYQRGEVEKSRTQAGHLPSDVIEHPRGLLIADFGVDWRTPKSSVKDDSVLKKWLTTIIQIVRANPSTNIRILGFSDCAGKERDNSLLRRGRARRVYQLLYKLLRNTPQWKELRPRITVIDAAAAGDYVADNSTVEGRAQNRGALIKHTRIVTEERPIVVTGKKTISILAREFEGTTSPLEWLGKFFDGFTLVEMGLAIAGATLGMEAFMLGAGIVVTTLAPWVAIGGPHEAALNILRQRQILEGLSLGIVLAADGRSYSWIDSHGVKKSPVHNINYPQYGKQLQGLYNTSLVAGIAHGRQFSTVATTNLFMLLTSEMRDDAKRDYLGYPNKLTGEEWLAYSKSWSTRKWDYYYCLLAAILSRHIKLRNR